MLKSLPKEFIMVFSFFLSFFNNTYSQQLPAIPQNFISVRYGDSDKSTDLSWLDVATNETSYQIDRKERDETVYVPLATLPANSTSYTDETAWSVFNYHYRIRAIGIDGNSEYIYTDSKTPTLVSCGQSLCYPENCTSPYTNSTKYTKTIKLNCDNCAIRIIFDQFNTALNYDFLKVFDGSSINAPLLGTFSGNNLPPTIHGSGSTLTFEFISDYFSNGNGNGWKFTTECIERPGRPEIVSHRELYSSEVTVKWNDKSTNETGFIIDKSKSPLFLLYTSYPIPPNTTEFYFNQLDSATTYYFRVRAITPFIESYNSTVYPIKTHGSPFQKKVIGAININEHYVPGGWYRMDDFTGDNLNDYIAMVPKENDYRLSFYRNKGNDQFELVSEYQDQFIPKDILIIDVDNDGDIDLVFKQGYDVISLVNNIGRFEKKVILKQPYGFNHNYGLLANDFDQDGDEDVFLYDKENPSAAWFKNNRNGEFSFDSVSFMKKRFLDVSLTDMDNNGMADLMTHEYNLGENRFYINQGEGKYHLVTYSIPASSTISGSLLPADTDNDGDTDLVLMGVNGIQPLINNGTTSLTVVEASSRGYYINNVATADLDNDGDIDFVCDSHIGGVVLLNKGNNKFVTITNFNFGPDLDLIKVTDLNGDSKVDVVIYNWVENKLVAWKNSFAVPTASPSKPTQITVTSENASASISWAASSDDKTPTNNLHYNYTIGKTNGGQEIRSAKAFHENGKYFQLYPQRSTEAVIKNLQKGTYYLGVNAIDAAMQSSVVANTTFQINESNFIPPPKGITIQQWSPYQNNITWTDDSDNEEGFILIRSTSQYSGYKVIATLPANKTSFSDAGLLQNTDYYYRVVAFAGNHRSDLSAIVLGTTLPVFSRTHNKFTTNPTAEVCTGHIQWVDINNDNRKDFIWTGLIGTYDTSPYDYVFQTYIQSENDPWQFNEIKLNFISDQGYHKNVPTTPIKFADFDSDGDIDLLYGRFYFNTYYHELVVMDNVGNNSFETIVLDFHNYNPSYTDVDWGDYDNDGDMDVLAIGQEYFPVIYINNSDKTFTKTLTLNKGHEAKWFDHNNDGWLDLVTRYGSDIKIYTNKKNEFQLSQTFSGGSTIVFADHDHDEDEDIFATGLNLYTETNLAFLNNDQKNGFRIVNSPVPRAGTNKSTWLDYNNDNNLDLLRAEKVEYPNFLSVYKGSGSAQQLEREHMMGVYSGVSINDIDGDTDMDIFTMGLAGNMDAFAVYENNSKVIKPRPLPPIQLSSQIFEDTTKLSWIQGHSTPGVTYNVMLGTAPGKQDIINSLADPQSGFFKINSIGNARYAKSKTVIGLKEGVYFWNVQAIDENFQGSNFSYGGSFVIGSPELPDPSAFLATPISSSMIKLNFEDLSATGKRIIFYSADGIQFTILETTDANEVIHSGLEPNHEYYYKIVVNDELNYSQYSPVVTAKTLLRPKIISTNLITVEEGQSFFVSLESLVVGNAPEYPSGYTLIILPDDNYIVTENLITPTVINSDTLYVHVQIASASDTSSIYLIPFKINIVTDVPETSSQDWKIYPTPVREEIYLENNVYNSPFTIMIFDNIGRLVYTSYISENTNSIYHVVNFRLFDSGLYTLHILDHKMKRTLFKVMKL